MIKYGYLDIRVKAKTLTMPTFQRERIIRHFPGTDKSIVTDLGAGPTRISCIIMSSGEAELMNTLMILHDATPRKLILGGLMFRDVVATAGEPRLIGSVQKNRWETRVSFTALDPKPYNSETGENLYDWYKPINKQIKGD